MKNTFNKLLIVLFLLAVARQSSFAQLSVPPYTACPCQVVNANVTWNNVSAITGSVYAPPAGVGGPPVYTFGSGLTFTVSNCSQVAVNTIYTVIATGNFLGSPTTQTTTFNFGVVLPAPMVLAGATNYCNCTNVSITAPIGGSTYSYSGGMGSGSFPGNVLNFPCAQSGWSGPITVTTVIGGCTVTGAANINVEPLAVFTISSPTSICQGTCVTLTSNLPGGTNYLWFDFFNAGIGNFSSQQVPPLPGCNATINNSGTYKVTAERTFNGIPCPYSATTQVTVVETSPILLAASPANIVCQGVNLNLSASVSNALVSAWSWTGPGFTSNIANPSISPALPVNSGTYIATAVFQGAFIACTTSAAISVSIVPVSIPVINMPSSVCQNQGLAISGQAAFNPQFTWSGPLFAGGAPNIGPALNFLNVQTSASGTQFLTATFGNNCSATSSVQLNVVPVNTVTVIPPAQVCSPTNAFLQALATGANQYLWVGPGGYNTPAQNGNAWVYYPTVANAGTYTVTAFFGSGTGLVCTNNNTVQLIVNTPLPFALDPRQQVCYNTAVTLTGPVGATSYTWTSSTGLTAYTKDLIFNSVKPNNSGTYTLNISKGPCVTGGETELVVLTPIDFTLTPSDRTICRGDTIQLEVGATGGSANYAYTWNPEVFLSSSNGPTQVGVPLGTIGYNVTAHDIACPNFKRSHPFTINVKQPPVPDLQLQKGSGCAPLIQTYNAKTSQQSFVTTYYFSKDDVVQGDPIVGHSLQAGVYNLTITTKGFNGCGGSFVQPYPIVVYPKPGTDFYWDPETPAVDDIITFYPTYKDGPIVYNCWNFLGGATPGDTSMNNTPGKGDSTYAKNPIRVYPSFGSHMVVLVNVNEQGCRDTVTKFVKVIDNLQLYVPNSFTPNDDGINDYFMPKGTGMKAENYTMDIFSRAGLNVFTTKDINEGWDGKVKGQFMKDATYIYKIRVVGMNGEGRKEFTGYFTLIK